MQDRGEDGKAQGNVEDRRNGDGRKWPVPALCFAFLGIYIAFSIVFGYIGLSMERVMGEIARVQDSTLVIAMILYFCLMGLLFAFLGAALSKKTPGRLFPQVITVLPVALLTLLVWSLCFFSAANIKSEFGNFSWLPYTLITLWATPLLDHLRYFFNNSSMPAYIGLIPAILPGVAYVAGVRLRRRLRMKKMAVGAACVPLLLLPALVITAVMPVKALFSREGYPEIDGATAAIPFAQVLMKELTGASTRTANESVRFNTTHQAYVNLINKTADVIFVAGPSDEELQLAKDKNVVLKLTPIGKDAFIFLVHRSNRVSNVSLEQIKSIYSGEITDWKEVGGESQPIMAYQREANSGSQTFMEKHVMKGAKLSEAPREKKAGSMGQLIDTVADYRNAKNAIGYSFYYFANEMHRRESVKFLSIDGLECSKENIISDRYPLTAVLYAVTREGESGPAGRLLDWLLTKDGSEAIEKGGFVPLNR